MGRGIASRLASEGADVVVNYRSNMKAAEETRDRIKSLGRDAIAIKADVSFEDEVRGIFEEVVARFGKIDMLVNNAGNEDTRKPEKGIGICRKGV